MSAPGRVTAEELVRALKKRRATLPAEIGSFVVLEACEALLASRPRALTPASVEITDEGAVRLVDAPTVHDQDAAVALHRLLTSMLVAAGPAPNPALMRVVEHGPSSGRWALADLRDDLEASLVPLNRQASRRVLARFVRELGWAERSAPRPSFQELDSELSSLLGIEGDAPGPAVQVQAGRPPRAAEPDLTRPDSVDTLDDDGVDQVQFFDSMRPVAREPTGRTVLDPSPAMFSPPASQPVPMRAPSERPPSRMRVPSQFAPPPKQSSGLLLGLGLVLLSAGVLGAVLYLRPELLARLTGDEPEAPAAAPRIEPAPEAPRAGDLVVRVATERAQVLRFVGRGPVTVEHLPLGVAHEFVAMADGLLPTRLLVPKDAEWEKTPDGQRYEAAMQLPSSAQSAELGESLLPQDVGRPSGALGTVRIVTTPKGAKVYQLIGFAPEARVEDLPLAATQELLIYKKGHVPEVRVVAPSDYAEGSGKKRAELDVTLTPLPKTR